MAKLFRFPPDTRKEVLRLLDGDECKVLILEDELSPEQCFVRNMTEIGPYGHTLRESLERGIWQGTAIPERKENRIVWSQIEKLNKEMQKTEAIIKKWNWYQKVADHREQNPGSGPNPLDTAMTRLEQEFSHLAGLARHYSGPPKDQRTQAGKKHVIAVVLSLFPGKIPVDGCPRKAGCSMPTPQYELSSLIMKELDLEPGDFRRIYTPAAKRLNKIRSTK
ncbi:MAG: hypothetical protein ACYCYP_01880 [Leptospirales bacterium]